MRNTIQAIVGVTLVVIAYLLHNFYISYHYARANFIVSWTASRSEYDSFIGEYAKSLVRPDIYKTVEIPTLDERFDQRKEFIRNYCGGFSFKDKYQGGGSFAALQRSSLSEQARFNPENYTCRKKWVEPAFVRKKILAEKGASLGEAIAKLKRNNPAITKGMMPSEVSAGENPSRSAMARSLWFGIILPIALLVAGLILLLMGFLRHKRVPASQENAERPERLDWQATPLEADESERYEAQELRQTPLTLGELLKQHFGEDLGVTGGSAKRDDPLVITETVDYVSIEYAVAKFLMRDQEYKKERQQLLNFNGRKVDELVFTTKRVGASEWETTRCFYFDITDGFAQLGK